MTESRSPAPAGPAEAPAELPVAPDPRTAPPLRWGVLGAGGIAGAFARDVPAHSVQKVVAVGSRDRERAADFADRHRIPRVHGSYEALVHDPEIDVVYVATPHSHHHDHARLALEAGKPVLVEKAFTRNEAEAQHLFDIADRAGLFVMEAMWTRFLPHMVALRGLVASGALGDVVLVQADHGQRLDTVPRLLDPALAGGALLDLGVYPVSFVHSVLGCPERVAAVGTLTTGGVDAQEVVTLGYRGPATAVCTSTMLAATPTAATVVGRAGRVEVTGPFFRPGGFTVTPLGGEPWDWPGPEGVPSGTDGTVSAGFQYQAAEVARCVTAGRQESVTMPWAATLEVMRIMDEVRRALGVIYPGE